MFLSSKECFCAFCRSARVIYAKKHLSFVDVFLAFAASLLLMIGVWQDFDPRFFMILAFALGFCEIFIQVRWRLSIACPHCGFDPVIYKKNAAHAARNVKAFLDRRREDPISLLRPSPKLPMITLKKSESAQKVGSSTVDNVK